MSLRFQLVATGVEHAQEELVGMAGRARDARPVMKLLRDDALRVQREQFETDGAHGGVPWRPDSRAWRARKVAHGEDPRPNRRTGALERSLTRDAAFFGAIRDVNKQSYRIGTTLFYARFQRRRRLIGMTGVDIARQKNRLAGWLLRGDT